MLTTITVRESQEFRKLTGLPLAMIGEAESNPEIDVMTVAAALYYIVNRRENPDLTWEQVLDMPIGVLMQDLGELQELESDEGDAAPLASGTAAGSPSTTESPSSIVSA